MTFKRVMRCFLCATIAMCLSFTYSVVGTCGSASAADCSLSVPTNVVLKADGKHGIRLTWSKVKFCDGYQVFMYDSKRKQYVLKKTERGIKGNACKISKLKKNRTYAFKVRSFRSEIDGVKYSVFSKTVKGRTKGNKRNVSKLTSKTSSNTFYLKRGDTKQIKVAILPGKNVVSKKITFISSNQRVASVSSKGIIKANGFGTATISAVAHNGVRKNFKIRVSNKYAERIPVLTYHNIVSEEKKNSKYKNDQWTGSVEDFKAQMKYLHDNGYKTISLDEFYNWYKGNVEFPKKTVVITFDDGYVGLYTNVIPILKQYDFKATAFIIGKYYTKEIISTPSDVGKEEQESLQENNQSNSDDVENITSTTVMDKHGPEEKQTNSEVCEFISGEIEKETSSDLQDNEIKDNEEEVSDDLNKTEISNEVDYYSLPEKTRVDYELATKMKQEYPELELQSHSYDLHNCENGKQSIFWKTRSELEDDFGKMRKEGFVYVAYPYGSFSQSSVDTLSKYGYKLGFGFGLYYKNATRYDSWYDISRIKINGQMSLRDFISTVKPE